MERVLSHILDVELGNLSVSWQKSFKDEDKIRRSDGQDAVALSAFMLTTLTTARARKALVKEMWESGAHIMVGFGGLVLVLFLNYFRGAHRSQHCCGF